MWQNVSSQTIISMQTSFFPPSISYTPLWISETYCDNDTLQYPLIFCNGEDGYYTQYIQQHDMKIKALLNNIVSATDCYSYRIMEQVGKECYLLLFHNLFNQFLVNMFAKIETERLNYICHNQKKLEVRGMCTWRMGRGGNDKNWWPVIIPRKDGCVAAVFHRRTSLYAWVNSRYDDISVLFRMARFIYYIYLYSETTRNLNDLETR